MPRITPRLKPLARTFLRQWREFRNLSQDQPAPRIGVDRSLLSKIENAKAPYNQAFLESAADAYLCTPADLLMRNPLDKSAVWNIMDNLAKAPKPDRERIIEAVQILLKSAG